MSERGVTGTHFALTRRQIVAHMGAILFSNLTSRFASTLITIFVARQVGFSQFGHYAASIALARVSSVLFSYGLDNWLLHRSSKERNFEVHVATCLALKVGLGIPWLLGIVLFTQYLDPSIYILPVIVLCSLLVWFDELTSIVWSAFRAKFDNLLGLKLTVITQLGILAIVLGMVILNVRTLLPYMGAQVISSAICTWIALYTIQQRFTLKFQYSSIIKTLNSALPFALSLGLSMVYGQADITIVAHFLGKDAAGIYSTASGLLVAFAIVPFAVYSVVLPLLNRSGIDIAQVGQRAKQLFLLSGSLALLLGLGVYASATLLVKTIYGQEYLSAGNVLSILSGVLAARCLTATAAAFLTATEIQWQRIIVQAIAAVLNISLNLMLVHDRGIIGVAQVYVVSEWTLVFGYAFLVSQWLHKMRTAPVILNDSVSIK